MLIPRIYVAKADIVKNTESPANTNAYVLDTPCGLAKYSLDFAHRPQMAGSETTATVIGLNPSTSYLINIVAVCDTKCASGGAPRTTAYTTLTIETAAKVEGVSPALIIVIVAFFTFCMPITVCCVRLYVKSNTLEKKLKYEMQDVRNVAAGGSVAPMQNEGNRSTLLSSGEERKVNPYAPVDDI